MKCRDLGPLCLLLLFAFHGVVQAEPWDDLAKRLAKGATGLKNKKVAVLTFPYHDGRVSSGSTLVPERLMTSLVGKKGVRVIERRLIEKLMAERKLDQTGVINSDNLKAIGTVLNADAIVTGTLIDLENGQTEINARMIRTDSGEVLSAGMERIDRTWRDAPVNDRPAATTSNPVRRPAPAAVKKEPAPEPVSEEAVVAPAPKRMPMKFSNESFPAGRRIYHGNQPEKPAKKKGYSPYGDREEREEYDDREPYYADADKRQAPSPTSKPPVKKYDEPTIHHPTAIGTVRSESNPYPYYAPPPPRRSSR